jgi:hypothetical protein
MTSPFGYIIKEARQAQHLTRWGLAVQVTKEDGKPISPQARFDIEAHHRLAAPPMRRELARVLGLDDDRSQPQAARRRSSRSPWRRTRIRARRS